LFTKLGYGLFPKFSQDYGLFRPPLTGPHYGQTERQLKTWIVEHKKAVSLFDYNSKAACHVYENSYHMDFSYVKVVGHEANFQERLFLEAWLPTKDLNTGNYHIAIPEVHESLARAQVPRYV